MIRKPIEINSNAKDSIVAVANFIESNPALIPKVKELQPDFLVKANVVKTELENVKKRNLQFEKLNRPKAKGFQ